MKNNGPKTKVLGIKSWEKNGSVTTFDGQVDRADQRVDTHQKSHPAAIYSERIRERNGVLNAFVCLCEERALAEARQQTLIQQQGDTLPPLAGIPLGVKDLEDAEGLPTSFGCELFAHTNIAKKDSVQVARLRLAGAIVVGKTNVPIFGSTSHTTNIPFGSSFNPWDLSRTPGGSSGGSAAAVAGGLCMLTTSADGGGSIRIPAAFTGTFGLKPTFGRVPETEGRQFGMTKYIKCVHFGPITRSVEDAAVILDFTAGYHPDDPTSLPLPAFSYRDRVRASRELPALKIAYSPDLGCIKVQSDVAAVVASSVAKFKALGHKVDEIVLDLPDLGLEWLMNMGAQEHAMLKDAIEGNEAKVDQAYLKGIELTKNLSAEDIGYLMRRVFELNTALGKLFNEYDVLITPAMPCDPYAPQGPVPNKFSNGEAFNQPWHIAGFCFPFNFSGHPAGVIRAGFSHAQLPVAVQIVCERHKDEIVLMLAKQFEDAYHSHSFFPSFPFKSSTNHL